MADKEEVEENAPRGNEWEVVSLTASAYAAAPGPKEAELKDDQKDNAYGETETSNALFMSSHFVFPPSEHEDLPVETVYTRDETPGEDVGSELGDEQETRSDQKDDEDLALKGLDSRDELTGSQFLNEKGSTEQNIFTASKLGSFHGETVVGGSAEYIDESRIYEPIEGGSDLTSDSSHGVRPGKDKKHAGNNLPCEAWWRRRAASMYAHAKEANAFWSVFIAATVVGLVILGQHWQQERSQLLQLKWQSSVNSEKTSRIFGPISRLKDVIVGGNRRGSFIRGCSSNES